MNQLKKSIGMALILMLPSLASAGILKYTWESPTTDGAIGTHGATASGWDSSGPLVVDWYYENDTYLLTKGNWGGTEFTLVNDRFNPLSSHFSDFIDGNHLSESGGGTDFIDTVAGDTFEYNIKLGCNNWALSFGLFSGGSYKSGRFDTENECFSLYDTEQEREAGEQTYILEMQDILNAFPISTEEFASREEAGIAVPEPSTGFMLALGVLLLSAASRRKA